MKPNALTHCWDVYDKENPTRGLNQQLLFLPSQVLHGLENGLPEPKRLRVVTLLDTTMLNSDIKKVVLTDQTYKDYLTTIGPQEDTKWTVDINGNLHFQGRIFVPEADDL